MPIQSLPQANIGNYSEEVNVNTQELRIRGVYKGQPLDQTIPNRAPMLVLIDSVSRNIVGVQDLREVNTWSTTEYIKTFTEVSSGVAARADG